MPRRGQTSCASVEPALPRVCQTPKECGPSRADRNGAAPGWSCQSDVRSARRDSPLGYPLPMLWPTEPSWMQWLQQQPRCGWPPRVCAGSPKHETHIAATQNLKINLTRGAVWDPPGDLQRDGAALQRWTTAAAMSDTTRDSTTVATTVVTITASSNGHMFPISITLMPELSNSGNSAPGRFFDRMYMPIRRNTRRATASATSESGTQSGR